MKDQADRDRFFSLWWQRGGQRFLNTDGSMIHPDPEAFYKAVWACAWDACEAFRLLQEERQDS